jgi:hypothetical protein
MIDKKWKFTIKIEKKYMTYSNLPCESFLDPETGRIRVRPIKGHPLHQMVIECSRSIRNQYPVGTLFYCEEVKVCRKPDGREYLRAKDQMIYLYQK